MCHTISSALPQKMSRYSGRPYLFVNVEGSAANNLSIWNGICFGEPHSLVWHQKRKIYHLSKVYRLMLLYSLLKNVWKMRKQRTQLFLADMSSKPFQRLLFISPMTMEGRKNIFSPKNEGEAIMDAELPRTPNYGIMGKQRDFQLQVIHLLYKLK